MNHLRNLIILGAAALLVWSCGEDTLSADDVPPQRPVVVPRTDDDAYPQAGVRAEPTSAERFYWVRIEWYRNSEGDLSSYRVRRWSEGTVASEAPIIADLSPDVDLLDNPILFWVDRGDDQFGDPANLLAPTEGFTRGYWWQVQAVDTAGNRSDWSDSLYFRLLYNPYNLNAVGTGDALRLTWNYPIGGASTYLSYYKIRVYSAWFGVDSVKWDYQVQLYADVNSVAFGEGGAFGTLTPDCSYVWQLNAVSLVASDSNDVALAGAAQYITFNYQE